MPKLRPLPIPTKHQNPLMRILVWLYAVRKWEVIENWIWEMDKMEKEYIVIPKGFIFDGPSIPRIFWFILSPVGLLLIPGLVHDFGYRYNFIWVIRDKKLVKDVGDADKSYWDLKFLQVGIRVNGFSLVDTLAWLALVVGGHCAYRGHRKNPQEEIPLVLTDTEKNKYLDMAI
jgi:hypothetical protein